MGAVFKHRGAVVSDQSALGRRESTRVFVQRRREYRTNVNLDRDLGGGADDWVGDGGRIDCGGNDGGPPIFRAAANQQQ
jgi:hypothetical protein